jgi:PAS domain S-box-containing protein
MREMATIVECSDDAIYSANPDGIITSWNRGAERVYGYTAEEAVGMHVAALAPPERRDEIEHNSRKLNYGASVPAHETERLQKDGSVIPVLLTLSPLRTSDGKIVGAFAVARNISAQRQSEEAIRRSEKLATAGRMAASIAHEINNPLEAVLNLLYLARNDPRKAGEYLSMAEREIGRVSRLAQQALGFVRDTKNVTSLNPAAILDEILELYSRKIDAKKIQVLREYRGQSQIHGYSGEVHQLLANLLVNAVDAMEAGGCLRVRVSKSCRWSDGTRGIRVIVADNGKGIPRENLARVFEPFYTTKQGTGTGLGLWVSQGIVRKHGGSIQVRSRARGPHRGTLFSIFIPSMYAASQVA